MEELSALWLLSHLLLNQKNSLTLPLSVWNWRKLRKSAIHSVSPTRRSTRAFRTSLMNLSNPTNMAGKLLRFYSIKIWLNLKCLFVNQQPSCSQLVWCLPQESRSRCDYAQKHLGSSSLNWRWHEGIFWLCKGQTRSFGRHRSSFANFLFRWVEILVGRC